MVKCIVKKNDQDTSLFNTDIATNKDFEVDKIKTTNVNILLNRVRLDQKKIFKKRLILTAFIIIGVSLLVAVSIL